MQKALAQKPVPLIEVVEPYEDLHTQNIPTNISEISSRELIGRLARQRQLASELRMNISQAPNISLFLQKAEERISEIKKILGARFAYEIDVVYYTNRKIFNEWAKDILALNPKRVRENHLTLKDKVLDILSEVDIEKRSDTVIDLLLH